MKKKIKNLQKIHYFNDENEKEINNSINNENEKINDSLEIKISKIEKQWVEEILKLSEKIKFFENLISAQSELLSYREILLEKRNKIFYQLINFEEKLRKIKAEELINIYQNNDNYLINLKNNSNIFILLESKISNLIKTREILKNHLEFFDKTIETVDKLLFAIKNRINIEEILKK